MHLHAALRPHPELPRGHPALLQRAARAVRAVRDAGRGAGLRPRAGVRRGQHADLPEAGPGQWEVLVQPALRHGHGLQVGTVCRAAARCCGVQCTMLCASAGFATCSAARAPCSEKHPFGGLSMPCPAPPSLPAPQPHLLQVPTLAALRARAVRRRRGRLRHGPGVPGHHQEEVRAHQPRAQPLLLSARGGAALPVALRVPASNAAVLPQAWRRQ